MGCTGHTPVDNDDDIEDYDERYNFYNFKSKRKVKNPMPPSKTYPTEDVYSNDNSDNNNNKGKYKGKNGKDDESNNNSGDDNNRNKKGDLYRNDNNKGSNNKDTNEENNKANKNPNGDIYDLLSNNSDNNSSNGGPDNKKKKKKDNINSNANANDEDNNNNYSNIYMDDDNNKVLFNEKGNTIPEYGVEEKEKKKEMERKEEEKKKNLKKSKINGITIVQKLKEYFPEDITLEEIKNLVFEAFGDLLVDDMSLYIPGQTVTYEQAEDLSYYIYNIIINKKNENEKLLEELKVKIDLVPLNKKLIKEKMFKGQDPSDKQVENIYQSYGGESNDMKVLTIEFQ